jgi:hemerythrin-like domain-containing protein
MRATDVLKSEHRVIEQVLNCLEAIADRACATGALDGDSAREVIDFLRHFADGCHHAKEEEHLFKVLEARGFPATAGPTAVMRAEHEMGRLHVRGMKAHVDAAVAGDTDAVAAFAEHAWAYVNLLREHIRKEDLRLFPLADHALAEAEQQALLDRFEAVEREEAGEGTHERYLALADALAQRWGVPRAAAACPTCCGHARR